MSSYLKSAALAAVLGAAVGTPALAQDAGVDVSGFVDTYYAFNTNDPSDRKSATRAFDSDHNSLTLAVGEIAFEKKPTSDSKMGFRVDLNFGPVAEAVNAFEESDVDSLKNLQQAYVSWMAGDKLQFDFGKFVTWSGAEVIESKDNWNYTRSVQFGWAIPFYHTGLRATLTPSDKVTLAAFLVNGWNNVVDNNDDKTFGAQAILKPSSKLTWINNVTVGKETADTRFLYDTILSLSLSDKFSLMGNFDYGTEDGTAVTAVSAYAKLTAGSLTFVPRVEMVDDEGTFDAPSYSGLGTKVMTYTLTTEFKLGGGVLARIDLRHDAADDAIFAGEGTAFKDSQSTATLGLVYAFGGKI